MRRNITLLGMCSYDATEHKLRPSNGLRALATGGVSTIVMTKYVIIKHRYRTIQICLPKLIPKVYIYIVYILGALGFQ
jgi:hypothetical protein